MVDIGKKKTKIKEVLMNNLDRIEVLGTIAEDAEKDVREFEGKVANGSNIADFNGKQNAMIQALARILKETIQENDENSI